MKRILAFCISLIFTLAPCVQWGVRVSAYSETSFETYAQKTDNNYIRDLFSSENSANNAISEEEINSIYVEKIRVFLARLIFDFNNFNLYNNDEQVVLSAGFFSAYKGKLVLKTGFNRSGHLNLLFISNSDSSNADVVKHEYGHLKQQEQLSRGEYLFFIFIPSLLKLGDKDYYSKPWEITADILGEVTSRQRDIKDVMEGFEYLELAGSDMPLFDKLTTISKYY